MSSYRLSPSTEQVRRYLLQQIARCQDQPLALPSERVLSEKLGVSRVTVRRGIVELEQQQFIIRLPGHRAAYANPGMASKIDHAIGLMIHQNYVGRNFSQFLSGLSSELYSLGYAYNFSLCQVHEQTPEEQAFVLEHSGLDCLVWHLQTPEDLKIIDCLIQRDFPVLTLCNPNYPEWGHPSRAWYALDIADAGKAMGRFFQEQGCRHLMFCSHTQLFRPYLEPLETVRCLPMPQPTEALLAQLKAGLDQGCDGLFCHLGVGETKQLLDCLQALQPDPKVKILLYRGDCYERCQLDYPGLQIFYPDFACFQKKCLALGRRLAQDIAKWMVRQPGLRLKGAYECITQA